VPYITAAALLDRYDYRWLGDRVLDTGTRATAADLQNDATDAGRRLALAIADATAEIDTAVTIGNRYRLADLAALVADQPTSSSATLLARISADLAVGFLAQRRVLPAEETAALSPAFEAAQGVLIQLRNAERILVDVPEVPEAGEMGTATGNPTIPPLSSVVPKWSDQLQVFGINRSGWAVPGR
jgi:hypothetical protein